MDNQKANKKPSSSEKQQKSIKKNYLFNLLYQLFALITPLITTPYISRVLRSSGVGQYAFTYSLITYFVLFGALGFGYYAQREIARYQGNREEQSKVFFEILLARFVSVFFSLTVHIIIILCGVYDHTYATLMWILTINIISTAVDVTFLFQGNEEFGVIALRNIIIKIIGIILIFVFVKNETHVWIYALCQSVVLVISNLSLWTRIPKFVSPVKIKDLNLKRHIVPTLRLFIPTVAVSVYTVLDKTLIGIIVPGTTEIGGEIKKISDIENGYYEQAEKMVKMALTIITSLGTVMIPRNSNAVANGDTDTFISNVNGAIRFVFFLGIPIMFGIAVTSYNFSPWFFGDGYEKVPHLIAIMSPLVILIGLSNVLGLQYLIPKQNDNKYTIAIICGAASNLILNIVLIHFYWSFGASIATVCAELIVLIIMLIFARKDIHFFRVLLCSWKYVLGGIIMFASVYFTQKLLSSTILNSFILIAEGVFVYVLTLFILRDQLFLNQLKKLFSKLFKKKSKETL